MSEFDKYIKKADDIKPKTDNRKNDFIKDIERIVEERQPLKIKPGVSSDKQPTKNITTKEENIDDDETILDEKDKEKILKQHIASEPMKKRELKLKLLKELDPIKTKQTTTLILAAIGGVFIFGAYQYIKEPWVLILMMVMGSCMFLPTGMILGWVLLDSYMRTRIMRRISHKNYGVINFIGKGNKMVSKMKNFDNDLIWIKDKCWIIRKGTIILLNKDGNAINEGKTVNPQSIVTMMDTIPVMFVDLDSLEPLSFNREPREQINPIELAANVNSYIDNQLAKIMFLRKTMDVYFMIVIICSVVAVGISYLNMNNINDMSTKITAIQNQLNSIVSQLTPTAP